MDSESRIGFRYPFLMSEPLPTATWKDRLMYLMGRRLAFKVEGASMEPGLTSGDVVLVDERAEVRAGDIVLALHPYKLSVKILKRVGEIDGDGRYQLFGDNPAESSDSRTLGTFSRKDIIGKAVCRLK